MIATFWFGVTFTAWAWALRVGRHNAGLVPDHYQVYAMLALAALGWSAIFPASYALIGRVRHGLIVGLGMWAFLLVLSFFFLV
jgi:hypothetical protein